MTSKVFDLAEVLLALGKLAQSLAQDLAQLARLATSTTIMINRDIGGFLDFGISFVLEISFHWSMIIETASITLLDYGNELTDHFSFGINTSFNDLLLIIEIPIYFIKISSY